MKKTVIFAVALLFMAGVKAQSAHFGLKGGLNASSLSNSSSSESKIGFNAGILAHIHTSNKMWAIQPEVYYSDEGAKSKSNNDVKLDLGYINIPILAQYMFDQGWRIEAGPQVGFAVSAKSKDGSATTDIKSSLNSAVFSIPVGLGYLTSTGLGFDARYDFGISNIYKSSLTKVHSNVFQFDVFYQFPEKKR